MAVLKFLFYLIAYFLIRIGLIVDSSIRIIWTTSSKIISFFRKKLAKIKSYSPPRFSVALPEFRFPKISRLKFPKLNTPKFSLKIKPKQKKKPAQTSSDVVRSSTVGYRQTVVSKLKYFLFGAIFSFIFVFIPLASYIFVSDLPTLDALSVSEIPQTTKLYDRNGQLLYEFYASQNRTIVSLDKIPQYLKEATIAIEDQNFYSHPGFDLRGISRAIVANITKDELQGGSTITQQLIKSALLTPEVTITRKAKEVALSLIAEQKYTKDEILELYFNYVPYGGTAWGIEAASEAYFGKDVSQVSLSEAAFLAGLPRAPSIYSPFINSQNTWKKRQWEVLTAMVRDGYISEHDAHEAYQVPLSFKNPQTSIKAPHFVMYVKSELIKRYGIYEVERGGLQIVTSLDLDIQREAELEVEKTVSENAYLGIGNAATVVTDPATGDILAMVGSKDFFDVEEDGNVNLTTALRQPGSTIKLITYTAALENGFSESSILQDTPITIQIPGSESYKPVNYDGKYRGMVPFRLALANSYNIPAVRIAEKLGPDLIAEYGRKMGISSWNNNSHYGLSITLGGNEVTMLDLATAYGTIANYGERIDLDPILEVKDSSGEAVYEKKVSPERVVSQEAAFIIGDILADNQARSRAFGQNSPLNIAGKRVSVKTGTTDNKRDNWTVGFTKDYVVATWVGNNDNTPLSPTLASGITGAAPMWRSIIESLVKDNQDLIVSIPVGLVSKKCFGYDAYFINGTEEKSTCRMVRPTPTFAVQ